MYPTYFNTTTQLSYLYTDKALTLWISSESDLPISDDLYSFPFIENYSLVASYNDCKISILKDSKTRLNKHKKREPENHHELQNAAPFIQILNDT